ncbi:MAG: hypothetical protein JW804_02045 [Sedimentisphaerales bacterium]|nr:hypothetical protein [Sedimentisphaerales bacterium]
MRYTVVPKEISSSEIMNKGFSFSSAQYKRINISNTNCIFVRDFLSRNLRNSDLGSEVGSVNYIDYSPKFFFRTKGLQEYSLLPDINSESVTPVNPKAFINHELKEGDVIISKDSNIGEVIILDIDYPDWMLSGALYKLPIKKWKYYLLTFMKHKCFREQLDFMVPKSATIRHAKSMFLDCKVPLPNKNQDQVIKYVEELTKALINKEKKIKSNHQQIHQIIKTEIEENQKSKKFQYEFPSLDDLKYSERMDTSVFTPYFKCEEFKIKNYKNEYSSIEHLDFGSSRGQNLQISNIGESIYSDRYHKGFYTLMLPKHLSKYGTVNEVEYLGNRRDLKILKKGDLIFGAEGFEKGRSIVILDERGRTITNIHGITLHHKEGNIQLSIFVKCFLDYLRNIGLLDRYAVGGNGGSLAMKYWSVIPYPNFPDNKQKETAKLYHNPQAILDTSRLTIDNFVQLDNTFNQKAGITELDETAKKIKARLEEVIDQIVKGQSVDIDFDFLK